MKAIFVSFLSVITLVILLQGARTACGEGCLACSADSSNNFTCDICDAHNQYFRKPGSKNCEKIEIPNCEVASVDFLCFRCAPGHILDQVGGKCLQVHAGAVVPNCYRYSQSGVCVECKTSFFMSGSNCLPTTKNVVDCAVARDAEDCLTCKDGFFLQEKVDDTVTPPVTKQACVKMTEKDHCLAYSLSQCDVCKTGKIINRNYSISASLAGSFLQNVISIGRETQILTRSEGPVCVTPSASNCATIKSSTGDCEKCVDGYYKNTLGVCVKNPEDSVANCAVYASPNNCSRCKSGFFISNNTCKTVTSVDFCATYSPTTGSCTLCQNEYYLESGKCLVRTKIIIPQCTKLFIGSDKCETCQTGYKIWGDFLGCEIEIPNCQTYAGENTANAALPHFVCQNCKAGFYPIDNGKICQKQFIANCLAYTANTNTCLTCLNANFYKDTAKNRCIMKKVPNCGTPNVTNHDKCDTCKPGYYLDTNKKCHRYTVTNCADKETTEDKCKTCDLGLASKKLFYLDSDKRCKAYSLTNCSGPVADKNECQTCTGTGFQLDAVTKTCKKIPVPGCSAYNWTTKRCTDCANKGTKWFLDTTTSTCQRYTLEGCPTTTYNTNKNECSGTTCATGYYKKGTLCVPRDLIGCSDPEITENKCKANQCQAGKFWRDATTGLCKPYSIDVSACNTLSKIADECTASNCKTGFSLDAVTKNCVKTTLPGCSTINTSDSTKCTTCDSDFVGIADGSNKKCYPRTKFNCKTDSTTADECLTCETTLGYVQDSTTKNCIRSSVHGCDKIKVSDGSCEACNEGLKLSGTGATQKCEVLIKPHCVKYNYSTGNCTQCSYGFYASGGNCLENSSANCSIKNSTNAKCMICNYNFYKNGSGDCTAITKDNCYETKIGEDKCTNCQPGFKFVSNDCNGEGTIEVDSKCLYSAHAQGKCEKCKSGYFLFEKKKKSLKTANCIAFTAGSCTKCKNGYQLKAGTPKTCLKEILTTVAKQCLSKVDSNTTALSVAGNCAELQNNVLAFLNSGTSTDRVSTNEVFGCGKNETDSDACKSCPKDKPPYVGPARTVCVKQKISPAALTTTNDVNCLVQTEAGLRSGTFACEVCDHGSSYSATCQSKSPTVAVTDLIVSNQGNPLKKPTLKTPITNTSKHMIDIFDTNNLISVECQDGKVPVFKIDNVDASTYTIDNLKNFWDPLTDSYSFVARNPKLECKNTLAAPAQDAGGTAFTVTNCGLSTWLKGAASAAMLVNDSDYCVRCKAGYKGKVKVIGKDSAGTALTAASNKFPKRSLECVDKTDEFEKNYHGLGYKIGEFNTLWVGNDTCRNGLHLVYFLSNEQFFSAQHVTLNEHKDNSGSLFIEGCYELDHAIANCQIHKSVTNTTTSAALNVKATLATNLRCLSCAPGFKMTPDGANPFGVACVRIANCNISDKSKNKWMNACNTCADGYSWNYTANKIVYDECVSNKNVKGCAVVKSGVCTLCHRGYDLYNGKCYNQSQLGDSNCLEWAFGNHDLTSSNFDVTQYRDNAGFFYHFFYGAQWTEGCGVCKPGYTPVYLTGSEKICHKAPFPMKTVDNCEEHDIKNFNTSNPNEPKCSTCEKGYFIDNGGQKCTRWVEDRHIGCSHVNAAEECVKCFDDYQYFDSKKLCISQDDLEMSVSTTASLMFKEGRRPVNFTDQINVVIPIEDRNECSQYSHTKCIKCKNADRIPLILTGKFLGEGVEDVSCVEFGRSGTLFPMYLEMNYSNPENIELTGPDGFIYEEGTILITDTTSPALCSAFKGTDANCLTDQSYFGCKKCAAGYYLPLDAGLSQCQPIQQANCTEWHKEKCSKCHSDYYLNPTFQCVFRTVRDCKEYSNIADQCVVCYDGYFYSLTSGCTAYTKKNCKTFFLYGDYCKTCLKGFYFDTGDCKVQDMSGCKTFYETKSACKTCKAGYYLNSDTCKEYTIQNCSQLNPNSDTCMACNKHTYLDDNRKCRVYSVNDCLEYSPIENKCASCPRNRYLHSGSGLCKSYTVKNCKIFSPIANKCDKCLKGTYPTTNGNCVTYTVRNCKVFSPIQNGCLSCLPGFYRNGIKCSDYTAENCSIFDLTKDKCLDCLEGFYLDPNNNCFPYTGTGCKVRLRHADKCSICLKGYYLTEGGRCKPYTLERCEIKNQFEDKCLSCEKGTYLKSDRCHLYSAQNCRTFHQFKDWCASCRGGFYRMENGVCKRYSLENCLVSHPYKNYCEKCEDKHYLGSNYECKPYTHTCKGYNNFSDHCTSCPEAFHLTHDYKCVANSILNCQTYQADKRICTKCKDGFLKWENHCVEYTARNCKSFKSFEDKCELCLTGAYYKDSSGICLSSTAVSNCKAYKSDSNACDTCVDGFYLIGTSECRKNPEGIAKCVEYENLVTCLRCTDGWYLQNNTCTESATKVASCKIHIGNGVCGTCMTGLVLGFNNDCINPTNGTCLTHLDKSNCKTCASNFVLKKVGDVMNCVDSGIVNCSVAAAGESSNTCSKCVSGFILKDNKCSSPAKPIPGCSDYVSATQCSMCSETYVLSNDKKTCHNDITRLDGSCKTGHFNEVPKCYLCSAGYKFDATGNCVKCGGNVDGCDICGSGAQNCRVCKKGYYMTNDFLCVKYNASALRVVEDDGSTSVHEVSGASLWKVIGGLVAMSMAWMK